MAEAKALLLLLTPRLQLLSLSLGPLAVEVEVLLPLLLMLAMAVDAAGGFREDTDTDEVARDMLAFEVELLLLAAALSLSLPRSGFKKDGIMLKIFSCSRVATLPVETMARAEEGIVIDRFWASSASSEEVEVVEEDLRKGPAEDRLAPEEETEPLLLPFFLRVVKLDESRDESRRRLDGAAATMTRALPERVGGFVVTPPTDERAPPFEREAVSAADAAIELTTFDLEIFLMILRPFQEAVCSPPEAGEPSSLKTESSSEDCAEILADAVDLGDVSEERVACVLLTERLPGNLPDSAGKAAKYLSAWSRGVAEAEAEEAVELVLVVVALVVLNSLASSPLAPAVSSLSDRWYSLLCW